ncbi:hypothetical protein [Cellulomonas endophytica]|uniref:hypothetical protein n=1 Tax=Cellulomonas endophytica TaxID=2494735 RepID=UPI001012DC84|nr:hypothetical protein [Cellulomonas endophytica]
MSDDRPGPQGPATTPLPIPPVTGTRSPEDTMSTTTGPGTPGDAPWDAPARPDLPAEDLGSPTGGTGTAGATPLGATTLDPPAPQGPSVATVVWGLVVAVLGVGVLATVAGARIDAGLALIGLLALAGVALLVGSLTAGLRSARADRR